jgi:hypothetical protein
MSTRIHILLRSFPFFLHFLSTAPMKMLSDDVLHIIADFLWFQSVAMKNTCKRWQCLVSGRYSINASTSTGIQTEIVWPPSGDVPPPGGGLLWINVSDTSNRPLLVPHAAPPLGPFLRWVAVLNLTHYVVIGYTHTNPPHPTVLANIMTQKPSPRIVVQAAGRSLVVVATGRETLEWLLTLRMPFVCGPHRLRFYLCAGPVARWISVENYIQQYDASSVSATALAVEINRVDSVDPWTAFHTMRRHWRHVRSLRFSTADGIVDGPNASVLLRLTTTIKAVVQ